MIDAGRQHHVEPLLEMGIDDRCRICLLGHVDAGEVHNAAWGPVNADAATPHRRNVQAVLPAWGDADKGLLCDDGCRGYVDSGGTPLVSAMAWGSSSGAHKDHVPYASLPTTGKLRVPRAELLLAARVHGACNDNVGDEAAAGEAHANPGHKLCQVEFPVGDDAAKGCGLRHGPQQVRSVPEVLRPTPEGAQCAAHVALVALLGVDAPGPIEKNVAGCQP
mmetsp:Transcript_112194/g.239610  ORF Transcript_112194/g.239610 Transcript_112194/m.239610 type:complete len:220 (-) Transcript_112194:375-1034(-)